MLDNLEVKFTKMEEKNLIIVSKLESKNDNLNDKNIKLNDILAKM